MGSPVSRRREARPGGALRARWLTPPFTLPGSGPRGPDTFRESSLSTTAASAAPTARPCGDGPPPSNCTQKAPGPPGAAHPPSPCPAVFLPLFLLSVPFTEPSALAV